MWIEAFKSGKQTDSKGNTRDWTHEDLDLIVSKYNDQDDHEAPITIGHPADNAPAYGWVKELKRKGDLLLANVKPTVDDFIDWVKSGVFKKRSISLYADLTLRHIGFLGAAPPAIPGLADPEWMEAHPDLAIEFNDAQAVQTIEFQATENEIDLFWLMKRVGRIFKTMRDNLIETDGLEAANNAIPDFEVDALTSAAPVNPEAAFNEPKPNPKDDKMNFKEKIVELEGTILKLETDFSDAKTAHQVALDAANEERDAAVTALAEHTAKADQDALNLVIKDVSDFVDGLISDGCRLKPAQREDQIKILTGLAQIPEAEFVEVDGKKVNPLEAQKLILSALPKQVEFKEVAEKGKGEGPSDNMDSDDIYKRARTYQAEQAALNITVNAAEAVEHVMNQP